jgi:hypothetical protein
MIKIHKILKNDLSDVSSIDVSASGMSNASGMTISNFAFSTKQTEATIPYILEVVSENIPVINAVDFSFVIEKKVDLTATGVNGNTIQDIGEDVGKYDYKNTVPSSPLSLPTGFTEFYKGSL